jgi:3-deoxy-D-manno-octulosonic-acid transferase
VIFVKYEFWYYYLKKIKYRNIPLILISALFRKDMSFFKWYGGLQRKILSRFDHLFVQNESSKKLLDEIGLAAITSVSGDTRFDRVVAIADKFESIPLIEEFIGTKKTIVAGSTWKEDEEVLQGILPYLASNEIKLIIAPHEISDRNLAALKALYPAAVLYSELERNNGSKNQQCLIIDNIGMLSRLYKYAWYCYIGGGFTRNGIHNVLEAAVYNKPVVFGPYYRKYHEAIDLVETGAAVSIKNKEELFTCIDRFIKDPSLYQLSSGNAGDYVRTNAGATQKIMNYIQENRLLTS